MPEPKSGLVAALIIAVLGLVASLAIRPLMPPDETRYVQVAREMRESGDLLVPHFNGAPYPHKPPLLFWLMGAAWAIFGESSQVARAVAPAAGLACIALTWLLARRLWPDRPHAAGAAPLLLAGGLAWCGYSSLVMFDALLTACVLGALLGTLLAADGRGARGWLLAGACLGLGILAKGPITLLHALPPMLAAPLWTRPRLGRWYLGVALAFVVGAGVALAWALPAAAHGGPEFGVDMLWRQTAHRMVRAFAHARPPWWYLLVLPIALAPWSLWLGTWRALGRLRTERDRGIAFCAAWLGSAIVLLSLVSGKQAHYLLPALPGVALLLARLLGDEPRTTRRDVLPVSVGFAAIGVALLAVGAYAKAHAGALPDGMTPAFVHLRVLEPVLLILTGVTIAVVVPRLHGRHVAALAVAGVLGVVLVQASITGWGGPHRSEWPPWKEKHGDAGRLESPAP